MVTFVSFEGELLEGLDVFLTELGNLAGIDSGSRGSRIDTVGLDGDHDVSAVLKELVGVHGDDAGLIGLGDVRKDDIDHADEHAVALRHTGVLNDGDDVGALLGHVKEITAHTVGELDGVDETGGTDPVGNMRDRGTSRGTEIEDLHAGPDKDVANATEDTGSQLGAERVPDTILDLGAVWAVDGNALLAVYGLTDGHVASTEHVFLAASHKDTLDAVRFDDDLGAGTDTAAATSGTATAAPRSSTGTSTTTTTT